MKNSGKQKQEEKFYLKKFLESLMFDGFVIQDEAPEPFDKIVKINEKEIAVQITEFHSNAKGENGFSRRMVEEEWIKLQQGIEEKRKQIPELNNVQCRIYFNKLNLPKRKEASCFIDDLIGCIREGLSLVRESLSFHLGIDKKYKTLAAYVKKLGIKRIKCYKSWDWNQGFDSVGLSEGELCATIESKFCKDYTDQKFSERWLLIHSESNVGISTAMGLPTVEKLKEFQRVDAILKKGIFTKLYIFQYIFDRIIEWQKIYGWKVIKDIK